MAVWKPGVWVAEDIGIGLIGMPLTLIGAWAFATRSPRIDMVAVPQDVDDPELSHV